MKTDLIRRSFADRLLVMALIFGVMFTTVIPCGPGYVEPLFDTSKDPEAPFTDYAAGKLGIIKPEFRRPTLFAAFRYVTGTGMNAIEQQKAVEVWNEVIRNEPSEDPVTDDAVKTWIKARAEVIGKEEKLPAIYTERSYGGYDFFPNCAVNAFEVATETLKARSGVGSSNDPNVLNWVKGQDAVFQNCSSGKQIPEDAPAGSPEWLQKDRAYQKAAAAFYSLNYDDARQKFEAIAADSSSPWQETSQYLVGRTLVRQASLTKSKEKADRLYSEAEQKLLGFVGGSGKFSSSANGLIAMIKYRTRPEERVIELGRELRNQRIDGGFKQDLIDYTWLLDKFETEVLKAEEKKKEELANGSMTKKDAEPEATPQEDLTPEGKLKIELYNADYTENWTFLVDDDATDAEVIAAAEKAAKRTFNKDMRDRAVAAKETAYSKRFTDARDSGYEGDYYGEDKLTPELLPDFLKRDEMTDWIFTYQMSPATSYKYSFEKYRADSSELWLMTALSKASKNSEGVDQLIDAGIRTSRNSAAFPTIAFHTSRLLIDEGRTNDAKKLIDSALEIADGMPVSAQNSFMSLKLYFSATLDEWIKNSLKKPYGFNFDGFGGTIDQFVAMQKSYYDPEYNKDGREAFDKEVESRFEPERLWEHREMFDSKTIDMMNRAFPQSVLLEVESSTALPDHMRPKFALALWGRAFLTGNDELMMKMSSELTKFYPEIAERLKPVQDAPTPLARRRAALYFVLTNPMISPYIEDGIGKEDNEFGMWDANDWWCSEYQSATDIETAGEDGEPPMRRPNFLTVAQKKEAMTERAKIIAYGDAPKYLAAQVFAWAAATPNDKRVPEALYIVHEANGWTKYGCGNDEDIQKKAETLLKTKYAGNQWTQKMISDEQDK